MEEIKRNLFSRKQILLLCVLLIYNMFNLNTRLDGDREYENAYLAYVTQYQGVEFSEIMTELNEQTNHGSYLVFPGISEFYDDVQYLMGFDERLENIQKQAQTMGSVSIFAGSEFAKTNIRKTAEDYKRLEGIEVTLGNNEAVEIILQRNLSDWLLGIYMVTVLYSFIKERKRGLWNMVCASPNGRIRLLTWRFATVLVTAVGTVLLFTGLELVLVYSYTGGLNQLGRMVQSIQICETLTIPMTIGQFWIAYIVLRIVGCFFVGMLAWFLIEIIADHRLVGMVWALGVGIEYLLRKLLPENNIFYQVNLFTYLQPKKLLTTYVNLNLFNKAVNHYVAVLSAVIIASVIILIINALIYEKRKPISGYAWVDKIIDNIRRLTAPFSYHVSLFRHEQYKMLVTGKGIIIIVCAWYVVYSITGSVGFISHQDYETELESYYRQIQGKIGTETEDYIVKKQESLDIQVAEREKLQEQLSAGEIDFTYYQSAAREYESLNLQIEAFEQFKAHVAQLQILDKPYVLPHWVYEALFAQTDESKEDTNSLLLISIVAIVLILFVQLGVEKKTGMDRTQNSSPRGRMYLTIRKHAAAWVLSIILSVGIWGIYTLRVMDAFYNKLPFCEAPACCLSFFPNIPQWISVLGYWIMIVVGRILALCAISSIAFLATELTKKKP